MGPIAFDKIKKESIPYVIGKYYTIKNCRQNTSILYVFSDNLDRGGLDGERIIREEFNSIGIVTRGEFLVHFSDKDYEDNILKIEDDIINLKKYFYEREFKALCFPYQGIGTDYMQKECPRIFMYLCFRLLDEFGYNNIGNLKKG